jgi:hypothetical protein
MRPNLDPESKLKPLTLPPGSELEVGYIRYVRILPTEGPNGEICLETCIRRSRWDDDRPRRFFFSAISYAWGDPTPSHPVVVDGRDRLIAKNLWHFLQCANTWRTDIQDTKSQRCAEISRSWEIARGNIQQRDVSGLPPGYVLNRSHEVKMAVMQWKGWPEDWLWIDALCIDQSDGEERAHQVGIMSEIFGRADQVISWLGPACESSKHAMVVIAGTSDPYTGNHTSSGTSLSEAIYSLCERPYWKRLWVFQELKHARQISLMCGKNTVSFDHFQQQLWRAIVETATTDEDVSKSLRQSLAMRMMKLRIQPMDWSLFKLLKETKDLECADQRDRGYALLSVATEGQQGITADYDPGTTPLLLAHQILLNEYDARRPEMLNDIFIDCELLEDVFKMNRGDMLRYRRHDAAGYIHSEVQALWHWLDLMCIPGTKPNPNFEETSSYINAIFKSRPQSRWSWCGWINYRWLFDRRVVYTPKAQERLMGP